MKYCVMCGESLVTGLRGGVYLVCSPGCTRLRRRIIDRKRRLIQNRKQSLIRLEKIRPKVRPEQKVRFDSVIKRLKNEITAADKVLTRLAIRSYRKTEKTPPAQNLTEI